MASLKSKILPRSTFGYLHHVEVFSTIKVHEVLQRPLCCFYTRKITWRTPPFAQEVPGICAASTIYTSCAMPSYSTRQLTDYPVELWRSIITRPSASCFYFAWRWVGHEASPPFQIFLHESFFYRCGLSDQSKCVFIISLYIYRGMLCNILHSNLSFCSPILIPNSLFCT